MDKKLFNIKINTKYEYKVFSPDDAMAINTALNDFIKISSDPIKNIQCKEIEGKLLEDEIYNSDSYETVYISKDYVSENWQQDCYNQQFKDTVETKEFQDFVNEVMGSFLT
jgi:hypothetical protein